MEYDLKKALKESLEAVRNYGATYAKVCAGINEEEKLRVFVSVEPWTKQMGDHEFNHRTHFEQA